MIMATTEIKTVSEAAAELGLTPGRIRQICLAHGIGEIHGTIRVLTQEDIRQIQASRGKEGRPRKNSER